MMPREYAIAADPSDRYRRPEPRYRRRRWGWIIWWLLVLLMIASVAGVATYEAKTSYFQARYLPEYAQKLGFRLDTGTTTQVTYPADGPFDRRLGYTRLPGDINKLLLHGYQVDQQARFTPELMDYVGFNLYPPYAEKTQAGLSITDAEGQPMYRFFYPRQVFGQFDAIPPLMVNSLLFIEDRHLLDGQAPNLNPAVNWGRFLKAAIFKVGDAMNLDTPSMGGSTLATQIEKYRHSSSGITGSIEEKLRQMASASVRVYRGGADTMPARRQLVLDYLNTVPLSAAPGFGEVNGIGDGLYVWFGADVANVTRLLQLQEPEGPELAQQGLALRQIIALMIAHRRPSYYLAEGRSELIPLIDAHLRVLAREGVINASLTQAALAQTLEFRDFRANPAAIPTVSSKGINMVRNHLVSLLGVSLYDLDRMDISANTTLNRELQSQVTSYLRSLSDPAVAVERGLVGEYLLTPEQAGDVSYSFTLFERQDTGNLVRVQTDNTDIPFDINEGSKLELGSTAKLRVLSSYLGIIAGLYQRYTDPSAGNLSQYNDPDQDTLTRWVLTQLRELPHISLDELLYAAMERRYSASPAEGFFTGGGVHRFNNFKRADASRIPTVRESLQESINLPFVRMLREVINHITYEQWSNLGEVMKNDQDPRRKELLTRFADKESSVFLSNFWSKYAKKTAAERLDVFVSSINLTPTRAAVVYRYLFPDAGMESFSIFMQTRLPDADLDRKELEKLYDRYGPDRFNLRDQGYIARVHPLELWLVGYLLHHPDNPTFAMALADSSAERQDVYTWLMRTKAKNARDKRIRTMLEVEAFAELHRSWRELGYPFDHLVPSLATALGSSGDRPAALAELMGIILNEGKRLPAQRITNIDFAVQTPYEARLSKAPAVARQVMQPEVAAMLKSALAEVVQNGTARRLKDTLHHPDGSVLNMGGKTGTGDNQLVVVRGGQKVKLRALSRTATLVFYLGDNHFGTLTAFVSGNAAKQFSFTSALPAQVMKSMTPMLEPYLQRKELARDDVSGAGLVGALP